MHKYILRTSPMVNLFKDPRVTQGIIQGITSREIPEFSSENCFESILNYREIQENPNMIIEYKDTLKIN